jgi:hypothetical protein
MTSDVSHLVEQVTATLEFRKLFAEKGLEEVYGEEANERIRNLVQVATGAGLTDAPPAAPDLSSAAHAS